MKKRILSVLLVIALLVTVGIVAAQAENPAQSILDAAAALPQLAYTEADATPVNQTALCPVCGSNKSYQPLSKITANSQLAGGGTHHWYLDKEVFETSYILRNLGGTVHMYLNNGTIKSTAEYSIGTAGKMSIFGNGTVINTGSTCAIKAGGTAMDIYGGTYLAENSRTVETWNTTALINIYAGEFQASEGNYALYVNGGTQNIYGGTFEGLQISSANNFSKDYVINVMGDAEITGTAHIQKTTGILNVSENATLETVTVAGTLNVNGGEITTVNNNATTVVTAGDVTTLNANNGTVTVSGGEVETLNAAAGEVAVSNATVTTATVTGATLSLSGAPVIDTLDLTAATTLPITVADLTEGASIGVEAPADTTIAEGLSAADAAYFSFGGTDNLYETTVDESGNLVIAQKSFETPAQIKAYADSMTFPNDPETATTQTAYCPECNKSVSWKVLKDGSSRLLGNYGARATQHYYIAGNIYSTSQGSSFLTDGSESHIHLNGNTVSLSEDVSCFTGTGNKTNTAGATVTGDIVLFGSGTVAGKGEGYAVNANGGCIRIYGGTYSTEAADNTLQALTINSKLYLYGGTVEAGAKGRSAFINNGATIRVDGATLEGRIVADSSGGTNNTIEIKSGSVAGGVGMLRGTLTITGGSVVGDTTIQSAAKLIVNGNPTVGSTEWEIALITGAEVEVQEGFTGTLYMNDHPASGYNKAIDGVVCTADFAGKIYNEGYASFWDGETGLKTGSAVVVDGTTETLYKNATAAIAAAEGKLVKLYAAEDVVLAGNAAIDVNGFDITISGEGTVALADSVNKAKVNEATAVYGIVTLDGVTATGAENYIVLAEEENIVGAHYYEAKVSGVSLKTKDDKIGMYFKGMWTMDPVLKAAADVGVVVGIGANVPDETFYDSYLAATEGTHKFFFYDYEGTTVTNGVAKTSILIDGIMKNPADETRYEKNNTNGKDAVINAAAYIIVHGEEDTDYTLVVSEPAEGKSSQTVYSALKLFDDSEEAFNEFAGPLNALYTKWQNSMTDWEFTKIGK